LVAASFLGTSTSVVDQSMAAMLGPGAVSSLNYGNKVVALLVGVASLALSNAIFPRFSQLVVARDWAGARRTLRTFEALAFAGGAIAAAAFIVGSTPLVRLLFERGSFTRGDTAVVSRIQVCFLLQLPFNVAGMVAVRLLSALGKNQVLMVLGIVSVVVNVVGNLLFMRPLGVAGIALSTSVLFAVSCLLLVLSASRELRRREHASG
jgi:putative peptidoglycan lipid II flippase